MYGYTLLLFVTGILKEIVTQAVNIGVAVSGRVPRTKEFEQNSCSS